MSASNLKTCLLLSGIRASCIDTCIGSILNNPLADEILYVEDVRGRLLADPNKLSNINLSNTSNSIRCLDNRDSPPGGHCNQLLNIGMKSTESGFVLFGHEDQFWPHWDYAKAWKEAISFLASNNFALNNKRIVGIVSPTYEVQREDKEPDFPADIGLTQFLIAHTTLISRDAWYEVGEPSETDGIWWDARFQYETLKRDWWLLYCNWPCIIHLGSRSHMAHDWFKKWSLSPQWGNFDNIWLSQYGQPFIRPKKSFVRLEEGRHLVRL